MDRRECLKCVEGLLERNITPTQLLDASRVLSVGAYCDVVEERTIVGLCGYPLCDNTLGPTPPHRYHISLARKQVIDISQRKKFCSGECYKRSNYYSSQLSTQPSWARDTHRDCEVKLLDSETPSTESTGTPSTESIATPSTESTGTPSTESTGTPSTESTGTPSTESKATPSTESTATPSTESTGTPSTPSTATPSTDFVRPAASLHNRHESSVNKLIAALSTWHSSHEGLLSTSVGEGEGPLSTSVGEGEGPTVTLPPVDSLQQGEQRRRIVYQQISRNLPGVCSQLGVPCQVALPTVSALFNTFRLDRKCVTFRPKEWKVLLTVLLLECGLIASLEELLESHRETVQEWLTAIGASLTHLELLVKD